MDLYRRRKMEEKSRRREGGGGGSSRKRNNARGRGRSWQAKSFSPSIVETEA